MGGRGSKGTLSDVVGESRDTDSLTAPEAEIPGQGVTW
jgi:hypothetical protein